MVIVNLVNLASAIKVSSTGYELSEYEGLPVAAEPEQIYNEPLRQNDVSEEAKRQNDVLETPLSLSERLSVNSPVGISTSTQFQTVIYASPTVETVGDVGKNVAAELAPDQPNHPKQKYRLTPAAIEW